MTTVAEIRVPAMLRDGTRAFVEANGPDIARKLEAPLYAVEPKMRRLKGADGLLLKKRFLDAASPWEKFYWARIAEHLIQDARPIEEAMQFADEDLLMLGSALTPL
jgi:hypothetical protein